MLLTPVATTVMVSRDSRHAYRESEQDSAPLRQARRPLSRTPESALIATQDCEALASSETAFTIAWNTQLRRAP